MVRKMYRLFLIYFNDSFASFFKKKKSPYTLRKKGTKAVTGAVPFQKVHICTQRLHIGTLVVHIST